MDHGVLAFLISAGAVTLAEMGDKTQLLAMAFATRFKASKVLTGVFIATILNHACAVAVGNLLGRNAGFDVWVQILASLSFILFGLWTIHGDKLEGEEKRTTRFGAVGTVAIAFFIAELGDKTQLATIALAAKFPISPLAVLMGSTTGMMIADAIGIIVGVVMCRRIPEKTVKLVSAGLFIFFGILGTYQVTDLMLDLNHGLVAGIMITLTAVSLAAARFLYIRNKAELEEDHNPVVEAYCHVRELEE